MRPSCGLRFSVAMAVCASAGLIPACTQAAESASRSFTSTGGEQEFVVPAGVTGVRLTLVGASGGSGYDAFGEVAHGGLGATGTATLAVTPGETLFVEVGGDGQSVAHGYEGIGGFNGGGAGGEKEGMRVAGGGGGGATDVRTCSTNAANPADPADCTSLGSLASRLAVAAGGGGGGDEGGGPGTLGGEGGGAGGPGARGEAEGAKQGGGGGAAGAQSLGGAPGIDSTYGEPGQGSLGEGGAGGPGGFTGGGGGGGGGGIYGGGGGGGGEEGLVGGDFEAIGGGGGGGGGSSGVPTGVTRASYAPEDTAPGAQPSATFTWTKPPPAAATGTPGSITSTTATLNGTVNPDGSSVSECRFAISPSPPSGASVPCSQQVGAGSTPVAVSAALAGLSPATSYTVTLEAASAQGSTVGSPVTFATSSSGAGAPSGSGVASTAGAANPGAIPALTVSDLELTPARFHLGKRTATITHSKAKALPNATTISFVLSAAATVTLSFERRRTGVLVGHKCVAISKSHRKGKGCPRYTAIPHDLALAAPAGIDRITFDGVLAGGSRMAPGSYRLSVVATTATDKTQARQHPSFTLLG